MRRKLYLAIAVIGLTPACLTTASALDFWWNGPVGGIGGFRQTYPYDNWLGGTPSMTVPGSEDTAHFSQEIDQTYAVWFDASVTNEECYVHTGDVTFLLNGYTYAQDASITVGDTEDHPAELTLTGGTLQSGGMRIGYGNCEGTVIVETGASCANLGMLEIGSEGTGTFVIEAGAEVTGKKTRIATGANSVGTVTMGNGSRWSSTDSLTIGNGGTGSLVIEDGADVVCQGVGIGRGVESVGEAVLTGSASHWYNSDYLHVGDNGGSGTLLVEHGGHLNSEHTNIGNGSDTSGRVTITGGGSTWSNWNGLCIGIDGAGVLAVENGAYVVSGRAEIGCRSLPDDDDSRDTDESGDDTSGGTGRATVTGGGSTLSILHSLTVGRSAAGTLTVEDGGLVTSTEGRIGLFADSIGQVTVTGDGSEWENTDILVVGDRGTGEITVEDGGRVTCGYGGVGNSHVGRVTVTGGGSTFSSSSSLFIGYDVVSEGTVLVEDGGQMSTGSATLGCCGDALGQVTVTGSGSSWSNTGSFTVGRYGTGTFVVEDGAHMTSGGALIGYFSGSHGQMTVTGRGSAWSSSGSWILGLQGTGELTISDGAEVSSKDGSVSLGCVNGSNGQITVTGDGSTWSHSGDLILAAEGGEGSLCIADGGRVTDIEDLDVGCQGDGVLFVQSGGQLSSDSGCIACEPGSTGLVNIIGNGSTWSVSEYLTIGCGGLTGVLNIEDGGGVSNCDGHIALESGSVGYVTVAESGSNWSNSGNLSLGRDGTGSLTVEDGGHVRVDGTLEVGGSDDYVRIEAATLSVGVIDAPDAWHLELSDRADGSPALTIHEGTCGATVEDTSGGAGSLRKTGPDELTLTGRLLYTGTTYVDEGTLNLPTGSAPAGDVHNNAMIAGPQDNDWLTLTGDVTGAGSYTGNVAFASEFRPGNSTAVVSLENVLFEPTGTLHIEIGGTEAGELFDQLTVLGTAVLGGTLQLDLLGDYSLEPGCSYALITGPHTGRFAGIEGLPPSWEIFYTPTGVVLAVPEPSAVALLVGVGLVLVAGRRRRRSDYTGCSV